MNFSDMIFSYPSISDDQIIQEIPLQKKVCRGSEEGYECSECSDFYPYAELNSPPKEKEKFEFICYSCRKGYGRLFR
jgi:hypothetical protein